MKNILILSLTALLTFGCANYKKAGEETMKEKETASICPEDGTCTSKIFKNQQLYIQVDETGALYYRLIENKNTSVISFEYKKHTDSTLVDNHYSETLLFEIDNNTKELNLKDKNLQNVKMLFDKRCFCRGQAGVYKIEKGHLVFTKEKEVSTIQLSFEIQNIDQKLKTIQFSVK
jgi:sucrose-6-phosphate hydrolase SacC (GH32 family)